MKIFILSFALLGSGLALAQKVSLQSLLDHFDDGNPKTTKFFKRLLIRESGPSKNCFIDPLHVEDLPQKFEEALNKNESKIIRGGVRYLGFVNGPFRYEASLEDGTIVLKTKIHFSNAKSMDPAELERFDDRLAYGADLLSNHSPYSFPIRFIVERVERYRDAMFNSMIFKKETRGPYFVFWEIGMSSYTARHEIGHLFGLDDEYANKMKGSHSKNCDKRSFMCRTHGTPQPFHYYTILRRLLCD